MKRDLPPLMWLRAFEATGRHMSFMKAAEELNVTPSALSHQVRQLEERLGVRLFERLNRAIRLTEAGARCLPGLRDGFDRMADAMAQVAPAAPANRLVVGSGPSFSAKWLAPRLYRFVEDNPTLDVRIAASLALGELSADGIDIAIRFGRGAYPGLIAERLIEEAVTPLCAPGLLAEHAVASPRDLARVPLLHDDSMQFLRGAPGWPDWARAAGVGDIDTQGGLRFNYADHALDAAVEGAGMLLGRSSFATRDLRVGRLVRPFDLVLPVTGAAFWLVYPDGALDEDKTRIFRDWLLAEAEAETPAF